jgi:acrylyl-CoA reductase (NADPH)
LPEGLTLKEAMSLGTAGLTAALSVEKIVSAGVRPDDGPVIVSGASGGVGSMATAILSRLGFQVTAVSGKKGDDFLTSVLGAASITGRDEFIEKYNSKPLSASDFAAGIDNVGGPILSGILKSVKQNGIVTSCGNVASAELSTSVFPFILRGVTLAGIDSALASMPLRLKVWQQLATSWKPVFLDQMVQEITLPELTEKLDLLLAGKAKGRFVLRHWAEEAGK